MGTAWFSKLLKLLLKIQSIFHHYIQFKYGELKALGHELEFKKKVGAEEALV